MDTVLHYPIEGILFIVHEGNSNCRNYCCLLPDVRLVDGSFPSEGRLEVYLNGAWGTVNYHGFGTADVNVVCRSLGYGNAYTYWTQSAYGHGKGSILMDDVACNGNEDNIFDCIYNDPESTDSHNDDVAVQCQSR